MKTQKMWVVHKSTRAPAKESYAGVSWLGMPRRLPYRPQYDDYDMACMVAEALTKKNPVGFMVTEVSEI